MQKDNTSNTQKKTTRVMVTIPTELLKRVDEAAALDYTSRSDILRTALLWYLRPDSGRAFEQLGPNEIYDIVKQRKSVTAMQKMRKDAGMKDWSGSV